MTFYKKLQELGVAGGTILYANQFNKHFVQTNKGGYK